MVRAVLAKIARRSAWARNAAFVFEALGLAIQVVLAFLLFDAMVSASPDNYRISFDCTGIVLPILVICFLSSARSRRWCDR